MTSGRVTEWVWDQGTKQQRCQYTTVGMPGYTRVKCIHGLSLSNKQRNGTFCRQCVDAWKRHNYPSRQERIVHA